MRRAKVVLKVTCCCQATSLTAGERSDTETVTLRSERGGWKRVIARWYLAGRLLNLAYPFQNQVVNGHTGNLYATYRLINCKEKEPVEPSLAFLFGTDMLRSQHSYNKVLGRFSSVLIRVVDSGSHSPFRAANLSWKWRITR